MPAPAPPARSRAKLLARHGRASPALVCPLVLGQAAEIEALPMQWFLTDATKLANGLRALHGALGNDVIVTAAADGLAAAAAGAGSITAHPRVTAAVDATRFHQAAAVVVLADPASAAVAPRGAVVCLPPSDAGAGQGIALSADPAAWGPPPPGAPLVTSLGLVRGGFAESRAAVGMLTAAVAGV